MNSRTRSRSSTRSSDVGGLKLGVCFVEANREHSSDLETTIGVVLRASSERDSAGRDDIFSRYIKDRVLPLSLLTRKLEVAPLGMGLVAGLWFVARVATQRLPSAYPTTPGTAGGGQEPHSTPVL